MVLGGRSRAPYEAGQALYGLQALPLPAGLTGSGQESWPASWLWTGSTRQSARTRTPLTFVDRRLPSNQHRPRQPSDLGRRTSSLNTAARLLALLFPPSGHAPVVHRLPFLPNAARPSQTPPAVRSELRLACYRRMDGQHDVQQTWQALVDWLKEEHGMKGLHVECVEMPGACPTPDGRAVRAKLRSATSLAAVGLLAPELYEA